ncbi:MAG: porin [Proteobacteria bacterium]|nr:porin [Pseudomonadota bacterium]
MTPLPGKPWLALALLISVHASVRAEDTANSMFEFQGYGTLGIVHSSEDEADFFGSLLLENGAGHTRAWSPEVDSRIAAQLTATLSSRLSVVVQVIAEQQADGDYTPHVEWANVEYQLTPDASIRVGRTVLPSFMVSDYRKVGFANPWVRPPSDVYKLVPVTTNDGADFNYRVDIAGVRTSLQGTYGQSDTDVPEGGTVKARDAWGLAITFERGPASIRLAYQQTDLYVDSFDVLLDAFRQFGPEGVALATRYEVDGEVFRFMSLGAHYDPGDWFVMAEWGASDDSSAIRDQVGWYVSGGYRLGALTPYVVYSSVDVDGKTTDPGLTVSAYPPPLDGIAAGLNAALNMVLARGSVQDTVAAGVRWDLRKNFALKVQYDYSDIGAKSAGILGNLQPGFETGGSYQLISASLDFVF